MRGLHLSPDGDITRNTLFRFSRNSPGGVSFPKLEWLRWDLDEMLNALTFFHLFLSPHLKRVTFHIYPGRPYIPWGQLAAIVRIISFLPTSLEHLSLMCGQGVEGPLEDVMSSLVLRCGPSLRSFGTCVPLSEAAIHHLMQLPNLRCWITVQGPPPTVPISIFPSLEELRLNEQAALPWLYLLASPEEGILRNGSVPTNIRETLKSLHCTRSTIVDSTLLSSILKFRNLVELCVRTFCYNPNECTFRLTDDNVENLAATLPRLKTLYLGEPCRLNSCDVTVASLMSISIHCLDLTVLETHFNTLTIVDDMQRLLDGGSGRDKVKCKLRTLGVWDLPFEVRGEDIETVAMGFRVIFPCLTNFPGYGGRWYKLKSKLGDLRRSSWR
jgi:hypothetical protein